MAKLTIHRTRYETTNAKTARITIGGQPIDTTEPVTMTVTMSAASTPVILEDAYIEKPDDMSDEEFIACVREVMDEEYGVGKWDDSALK